MAEDTATKLSAVTEYATQVDTRKADIGDMQKSLDQAVLDAKTSGAKYREIASASGRSVAWVQAILNKMGYTGPRKEKREREALEASA